jgi:hypothetical protein
MAMARHFEGEETGPQISTGEHVITKENVDSDNVQRLIESNQ